MQLNLQHSKQAQLEINNWIDKQKQNSYIITIQEPYIYKGKPSLQPMTANKYTGAEKLSPRTAIYTSKAIQTWYLDQLSDRDTTVIVTKINRRTTLIASVYMDYHVNDPVVQPNLTKIMEYAKDKGYATMLCIDTNCHSTLNGNETNKRGEALEDFIANYKLEIENIGLQPTFKTKWGTSIIDLTLSKQLSVTIDRWEVSQDYNGSDYNTITFSLKTEKQSTKPEYQYHKADWETFKN